MQLWLVEARLRAVLIIVLCLVLCTDSAAEQEKRSQQEIALNNIARDLRFDFLRVFYDSKAMGREQAYALFVPERYDPEIPAPVVIFLHSYWTDFHDKQWLRVAEIPGSIQDQCNQRGWIAVGPEAGGNDWYYGNAENQVLETIEELRTYLNIDDSRIYLVGRSMGGAGALTIAMRHPGKFAAVVALAGVSDYFKLAKKVPGLFKDEPGSVTRAFGGTPEEIPGVYTQMSAVNYINILKDIPVFLIHGKKDKVISVKHSRTLAKMLKKAGGRVVYKERKKKGHDMEMIEWFADEYFEFIENNQPKGE